MICINCSNDTKVSNSRPHKKTPSVWRRRECVACGTTFTTHEIVADNAYAFMVRTKKPVPFSLPRLMLSIARAFGHRDDASVGDDAYWLAQTIAQNIQATAVDRIESSALAQLAYDTVSLFDATAGLTYGARHGLVHNIAQRPRRGRPRTSRRTTL